MKAAKTIWCWSYGRTNEEWYGAFDTKEQAVAEAIAEADGREVWVAPAHWPDVAEIARRSVFIDDTLEALDNRAADHAFYSGDDPLFECRPEFSAQEAEAALREAVAMWAAKYIQAMAYTVDIDKAKPSGDPGGEGE